jgi:tetratricopeptide (TPR) repeat protein
MILAPFFFLLTLDVKSDKAWNYHNKMSDYYFHKGNYPEMLYHAREMVKWDPKDVETWSSLGYYYWSMSVDNKDKKDLYMKKALSIYLEGLEHNKDSYNLYDEIGKFYLNSAKDYNSAIPYFEKAITKKDCTNIPYHILAKCYELTNNSTKALTVIQSCLNKFPKDAKAKVELERLKTSLN